mmetsp:Transcript_87355/g.178123  ORF Transcript_87355/g.178123 Transcript_87355/m.178123 type:complete len:298 (+) Transcript_87355:1-894(+)
MYVYIHICAWGFVLLVSPTSSLQVNASTRLTGGPTVTRGFVFIGISTHMDWCNKSRIVIESLNLAHLPCRERGMQSHEYCETAFIGDEPAVRHVRDSCPGRFDVVHQVDLQNCSLGHDGDLRPAKLCVRALQQAPFTYNIQMDFDTIVVSPEIETVFDVLQKGFDLTSAYECCAMHKNGHLADDALVHGWEMQTGLIGYTDAPVVSKHAQKAIDIYVESVRSKGYSSAEQNAETQALAEIDVHFFTLPPNFNMRSPTVKGFRKMPAVVAQWHYRTASSVQDLLSKAKTMLTNPVGAW